MTRIKERFLELRSKDSGAFIPYITGGDPSLEATHDLVLELDNAGADLIEIGVPFSDPIADGPVIQRSTERALRNGTSLTQILELIGKIRKSSDIPLILMSYYNPLLNHGLKTLARQASEVGLDGILASDLTLEEADPFLEAMIRQKLDTIFLAAPTSSQERVERIAATSTGFLYALARTGVTGETERLSNELVKSIRTLKALTDTPVVVGFGISTPEQVRSIWREADGVVVGSAIVQQIEKTIGQKSMPRRIGEFVQWLRGRESGAE